MRFLSPAHLAQALCHKHCDWNSLSLDPFFFFYVSVEKCWPGGLGGDVAFLQGSSAAPKQKYVMIRMYGVAVKGGLRNPDKIWARKSK